MITPSPNFVSTDLCRLHVRRTCAAIPDCRVEEVAGTGYISPLLIDRDRIVQLVTEFWKVSQNG